MNDVYSLGGKWQWCPVHYGTQYIIITLCNTVKGQGWRNTILSCWGVIKYD